MIGISGSSEDSITRCGVYDWAESVEKKFLWKVKNKEEPIRRKTKRKEKQIGKNLP